MDNTPQTEIDPDILYDLEAVAKGDASAREMAQAFTRLYAKKADLTASRDRWKAEAEAGRCILEPDGRRRDDVIIEDRIVYREARAANDTAIAEGREP